MGQLNLAARTCRPKQLIAASGCRQEAGILQLQQLTAAIGCRIWQAELADLAAGIGISSSFQQLHLAESAGQNPAE